MLSHNCNFLTIPKVADLAPLELYLQKFLSKICISSNFDKMAVIQILHEGIQSSKIKQFNFLIL